MRAAFEMTARIRSRLGGKGAFESTTPKRAACIAMRSFGKPPMLWPIGFWASDQNTSPALSARIGREQPHGRKRQLIDSGMH